MEINKLVKNTSYLMISRVFQFIAGLITTKVSAFIWVLLALINLLY